MIESFKSTLDEVREADILLHVVDVAHPFHDSQIETVTHTLSEIGAGDIPTILVLNKIDLLDAETDLEEMRGYYRSKGFDHCVFLSASRKTNLDNLKRILFDEVKKRHIRIYPNYLKNGYVYPMGEETKIES